MKIIDWGDYSWFIPLSSEGADKATFCRKAANLLDVFVGEYYPIRDSDPHQSLNRSRPIDDFHELNFSQYGGPDVKYRVRGPENALVQVGTGVHIWSHQNEWRIPNNRKLKEQWKNFDYKWKE